MLLDVEGRKIDVRVNVSPVIHGNVVATRLLDRGQVSLSLDKLRMEPEQLQFYKQQIHAPNGLIIATGPTGRAAPVLSSGTAAGTDATAPRLVSPTSPAAACQC